MYNIYNDDISLDPERKLRICERKRFLGLYYEVPKWGCNFIHLDMLSYG